MDDLRAALSVEMQTLQAAVDAFDEAAAGVLGVNRTDLRCLEILVREEAAAPSALGLALGLTTGSVTAMLDRLEKLGYLTRSPDPSDRRKVAVRATDAVRQKAWELYGPFVAEGEELTRDYSAEQLRLLADFLRRSRELYDHQLARVRELPVVKRRR
ncbi:MarR family transcriptional regulator [Kitasatospora kazusensis]|uniref:MarR family transcriptional regulator n=1 Tax=Kitasatospora kazusensis TaxID=407974 RepID=A0ABN2ZI84_9ACTN